MQPAPSHHIEMRPNRSDQPRAFIAGTRVRVQDIYAQSEVHCQTPEQIVAALPHLTLAQVHAALAYYFDHREAVLDEIRQDNEYLTLLKSQTGLGSMEMRLRGEGADDAVPSG